MTNSQLLPHDRRPGLRPLPLQLLDSPVRYDVHRSTLIAGPLPHTLAVHRERFAGGTDAEADPRGRLLEVVERSGLAGRGGGHFSVAAKWRTALRAGGGGMVVANGAEGEPASAKDAALLTLRPHLVLDGLAAAAAVTGATRTVVWLHESATDALRAVTDAAHERRAGGIQEPAVEIATGPDAYLTGESSAVVRALSGGPALPQFRRVSAATSGVDGLPTLVHNVETLARVALLRHTPSSSHRDSTLVTILDGGRRTVLEVDPSTTVEAATRWAGEPAETPQAVLLGGYGGSWLPWTAAAHLSLEHRALRAAGAGLGAGIVVPLPARSCGLVETAAVVDYLARSSARQCGPCLFGLRDIADLLLELARGEGGRTHVRHLRRYAGDVAGRGACHHPDGAVRLVATALTTFSEDVDHHARRRRCRHAGTTAILPIPAEVPPVSGRTPRGARA